MHKACGRALVECECPPEGQGKLAYKQLEEELASLYRLLADAGRVCMWDGHCVLFDRDGKRRGRVLPGGHIVYDV